MAIISMVHPVLLAKRIAKFAALPPITVLHAMSVLMVFF
jgi:hypothetical protein